MKLLRSLAKRIPGARSIVISIRTWSANRRLAKQDLKARFEAIYRDNLWQGEQSVSGQGSDIEHTRVIVEWLPKLLREYEVGTMLDVPCGDFHWMKDVNLQGVDYIGADIVPHLIESNSRHYASSTRQFHSLDLTVGPLPKADLILCRDCLVHLCFEDIAKALENIQKSGARYLLTSTFPNKGSNTDILSGQWRPLNLKLAPFYFPEPLAQINEEYDAGGAFADKSLALWSIADIVRGARII